MLHAGKVKYNMGEHEVATDGDVVE